MQETSRGEQRPIHRCGPWGYLLNKKTWSDTCQCDRHPSATKRNFKESSIRRLIALNSLFRLSTDLDFQRRGVLFESQWIMYLYNIHIIIIIIINIIKYGLFYYIEPPPAKYSFHKKMFLKNRYGVYETIFE